MSDEATKQSLLCEICDQTKSEHIGPDLCCPDPSYFRQTPNTLAPASEPTDAMVEQIADLILNSGVGTAYICDDPEEAAKQDALDAARQIAALASAPKPDAGLVEQGFTGGMQKAATIARDTDGCKDCGAAISKRILTALKDHRHD